MINLSISIFETKFLEQFYSFEDFKEILIYPYKLSKCGSFSLADLKTTKILQQKQKLVLVWDLLPDDEQLEQQANEFKKWAPYLSKVSFQDLGVGFYLQKNYPKLELHLNLERFSHNLISTLKWEQLFKPQLKKLTLPNLLTLKTITEWTKKLTTSVELLGCGRQEIFYSPRFLIKKEGIKNNASSEMMIESIDRVGSWNSLLQNSRGTILFNSKDLCIFQYLEEIKKAKIKFLRLDPYKLVHFAWIKTALSSKQGIASLPNFWQTNHLTGFLKSNRTDAQFKLLKNKSIEAEKNEGYLKIGKIIESQKTKFSIFILNQQIKLPCKVLIYTPEGKKLETCLEKIRYLNQQEVKTQEIASGYYITDYLPRAVVSSVVYTKNDNF